MSYIVPVPMFILDGNCKVTLYKQNHGMTSVNYRRGIWSDISEYWTRGATVLSYSKDHRHDRIWWPSNFSNQYIEGNQKQ